MYTSPSSSAPQPGHPVSRCHLGLILHCFLFLSPQIKPHCRIWWFLRPQPPSSLTRHQVYDVRSSPSHSLDQNPSTQRGTPCDTASLDSRLCTLPGLRLAALLRNSSGLIVSASFLPPLALWGSSADFLYLQCLSQAPHFGRRPGSAAFLPSQFPSWWRYFCLPVRRPQTFVTFHRKTRLIEHFNLGQTAFARRLKRVCEAFETLLKGFVKSL